ncbi:spore gernimation protein [Clostridium acetobutylicum]|nr:spore gernimation protein [Clostridium acetobutylicum]
MRYLSKNYLIFITLGTSIVTIKTYPTLLIEYGQRDTWISLIFSSLLLLIFAIVVIKAFSSKSDVKLKTIYFKAFGRYLGTFLLWAFELTLILTLIECVASESSMLNVNILDRTPPWYFILFFIVPATYAILCGENSMLILTIVTIFFIFLSGCNLSTLLFAYRKVEYILPMMKNGVDKNFIICVFKGLAMFSGFGIILPFIYKIKSREEIKRPIIVAWILAAQMQVFATSGLLMTITAPRAVDKYYPRLLQTQLVNYFNFIESGELYVLFQVIGGWFIKYILTFYAFLIILKQLNVKRKYVFYVITISVAILAYLVNRSVVDLFILANYYIYISFANFIIIPFIASVIFILKEKKSSKSKKQEEVETV